MPISTTTADVAQLSASMQPDARCGDETQIHEQSDNNDGNAANDTTTKYHKITLSDELQQEKRSLQSNHIERRVASHRNVVVYLLVIPARHNRSSHLLQVTVTVGKGKYVFEDR